MPSSCCPTQRHWPGTSFCALSSVPARHRASRRYRGKPGSWAGFQAPLLPSEGRKASESSNIFLRHREGEAGWEHLVKAQQFLSASLADKRDAETNHSKLSVPPTGGGKGKCSFVFWGFLSSLSWRRCSGQGGGTQSTLYPSACPASVRKKPEPAAAFPSAQLRATSPSSPFLSSFRAPSLRTPLCCFLTPSDQRFQRFFFLSSLLFLPRSIPCVSHRSLSAFPFWLLVNFAFLLLITPPAPLLAGMLPTSFLPDVRTGSQ